MILSQHDRDRYQADGYLVIDPEVPEAVLDAILAEVEEKYPRREIGGRPRAVGRVQDAWKKSAHVKELARAPKVLAILEELHGRAPLPFQTLNFPIGTQQRAHSDTIHFDSIPSGLMCGVWTALEDIDMDNGPLIYYPGSHKLPVVSMDDVDGEGRVKPGFYEVLHRRSRQVWQMTRQVAHLQIPTPPPVVEDAYAAYEEFIGDLIDQMKPEPQYGTLKKGQALIWASNLLHGGVPQRDMNRTRNSQVTHYYFNDPTNG
jgi:ectoine hydroxylase-related dioxygenase (phytanoyl-CoA dioxygenase family)